MKLFGPGGLMFGRIVHSAVVRVALLTALGFGAGALGVQSILDRPLGPVSDELLGVHAPAQSEALSERFGEREKGGDKDDPRLRALWNRQWYGPQTPAAIAQAFEESRKEMKRFPNSFPG